MRGAALFVTVCSLIFLPANKGVAQWAQTNGPEGGYTNVIFTDATSGNLFAGGNGFYKSNDNGATWTAANAGMDGSASPVAVVRLGANLFAASVDKMYYSTDNGNSWTLRSTVPAQVLSMGVVGGTLVVGTNVFGVYRSTNDGASWLTASGFPPSNNIVNTIVTQGTKLLAGLGGKGVWASTDNGATWSQSSSGLGATRPVNGLALHGTNILAATSDSAILVSTNGGTNWTASAIGMNPRATVKAIGSNGTTLFACAYGAYTGVDTGVVYRSTDNGASWVSVKSGLPTPNGNCLGFGTGKVLFGCGVGIYATTNNGTTWFASNNGLRNANALAMTALGSTLFAGHAGGISKTQDDGATWTSANNGIPFNTGIVALTNHDTFVFGATSNGTGVVRSGDNGATWLPMNNGLTGNGLYINSLAAGGSYVYAGGLLGGAYVTSNNGTSWTGPGTGLPTFTGVSTIFVDGATLWAGVQSNGVYRSTDNGATWTASSTGLPAFSRNVTAITRSGSNLLVGLGAASGSSVYLSTDNGANWTSASTGIPAGSYCSTLYTAGQFVFAGFNWGTGLASGIYRTNNAGASWTPVNDGLPNPSSVNAIAVLGTNMYASYAGVWKRPVTQITSVREVAGSTPEKFVLKQNYPNPFNPSTQIRFSVRGSSLPAGQAGLVTLKVFDVVGKEVATLVNESLNPGSYEATFDARTLASGTYFYKLSAGVYTEVKRMTLLK